MSIFGIVPSSPSHDHNNSPLIIMGDSVIATAISALSLISADMMKKHNPVFAVVLKSIPLFAVIWWIFRRLVSGSAEASPPPYHQPTTPRRNYSTGSPHRLNFTNISVLPLSNNNLRNPMNPIHPVGSRDGANLPPAIPLSRANAASGRPLLSGQPLVTSLNVERTSQERIYPVLKRGESPPRTFTSFNAIRPLPGTNLGSANLPPAIPTASAVSSLSGQMHSVGPRIQFNMPPAVPPTSSLGTMGSHSSGRHAVPKSREENMRPAVPPPSGSTGSSSSIGQMHSVGKRN